MRLLTRQLGEITSNYATQSWIDSTITSRHTSEKYPARFLGVNPLAAMPGFAAGPGPGNAALAFNQPCSDKYSAHGTTLLGLNPAPITTHGRSDASSEKERELAVYRIFSLVFAARGSAAPRRPALFRKTIDKLRSNFDVDCLVKRYGYEEVNRVGRTLMAAGAFDSDAKARDLFSQGPSFHSLSESTRSKSQGSRRRAKNRRRANYQAPMAGIDSGATYDGNKVKTDTSSDRYW